MKLNTTPRVALDDPILQRELREHAQQVNSVSENRLAGCYNAMPSMPTAGLYNAGDLVRNNAPSELGAAGARYVIFGWLCVVAGSPGTFVQSRFLTGN